ncbi:ISL3 family transposase [Haloechinothrix halophila]|uniref:ISL3 family transposase n=1 Tax=Haloechinothrix halophila TaxID=1069073 RepID=UPI00040BFA45|nr:ISL3 family transposase [Haloechinothrix halophila]
MFSGLSSLLIEGVEAGAGTIEVRASTLSEPVACPECAVETARVYGYVERRVADVPVDGRPVVVRARRMRCPRLASRQTFREHLAGVVERYQRRTTRLAAQVGRVVRELAGRAGARVLAGLGVTLSRQTALRALLRLPVPVRPVPPVIGVDDFALRKRQRYATVIINAETGERVDVLADRAADTLETWLRDHRGVQVVCRDGSGAYAEAIRRALPNAVQVADRWHLWHNLAEAVLKEVAAHSACWGKTGPPPREGKRAATTRERWQQIHDLLDRGVGLLEISRRLNLALNTVKRYARIDQPERLVRAPQYRPTLVDPFRDYLRRRREEDPAVPVLQLLHEITELGYTGSQNLLYRYITQGRVESDRPAISPKRLTRYLLTHPELLRENQRERIDAATGACAEMTGLAALISDFAGLLTPDPGNDERLTVWIDQARAEDLPHLHAFTRGLELDRHAADAALTQPFHNGRTEGVNTKTKLIKRQMYGRAGFHLLRHRILLG